MTTSPQDKKKHIDRIVKLFQKAEHTPSLGQTGATEAEMLTAVTMARELMARHQIAMADIELSKGAAAADVIRVTIEENRAYTRKGRSLAQYDLIVAQAVSTLTDTETYTRRRHTTVGTFISVIFLGHDADTALASELFPIWLQGVRKAARDTYGSGKNLWTPDHTAYAVGFAVRLDERAKLKINLSKSEQQTWGLVLASKEQAISRRMEELGVKDAGKNRRKKLDKHGEAMYRGYLDGNDFNIKTNILK